VVPGWIGQAADAPAVVFVDGRYFGGSGSDRLCEQRVGVIDGHDHSDGRATVQGLRIRMRILLHPECRSIDRELRDDNAARLGLETLEFNSAKCTFVEFNRARRVGDGQPRRNARGQVPYRRWRDPKSTSAARNCAAPKSGQ
jgi:hypothetical protein